MTTFMKNGQRVQGELLHSYVDVGARGKQPMRRGEAIVDGQHVNVFDFTWKGEGVWRVERTKI